MRLFYIDLPGCHHITELMYGIKAVYEMEQTFYPYLTVEFLPHRHEPPGIILLTKHGIFREYYDFKNPKDIEDLRQLIWKHVVQDYNILDIAKDGCLKDFRETNINKVLMGWQASKRAMAIDTCCKIIIDAVTSEVVKNNILHWVYRDSTSDKGMNRKLCKQLRYGECGDNYPPNSATFQRCVDEVTWLCNEGYPHNKRVMETDKLIEKTRNNIYQYLLKNDLKVDKRKFDEIMSAGLFDDLGNRMGNKVANYENVKCALNDIFTEKGYFLNLVEGFNGEQEGHLTGMNIIWILICFLVLVFIMIMCYRSYKNKKY
jgi:hypothetical protein